MTPLPRLDVVDVPPNDADQGEEDCRHHKVLILRNDNFAQSLNGSRARCLSQEDEHKERKLHKVLQEVLIASELGLKQLHVLYSLRKLA